MTKNCLFVNILCKQPDNAMKPTFFKDKRKKCLPINIFTHKN